MKKYPVQTKGFRIAEFEDINVFCGRDIIGKSYPACQVQI